MCRLKPISRSWRRVSARVRSQMLMVIIKNIVGTWTLFGVMLLTAWALARNWPMSFDRALMVTCLAALAQLRWHQ